MTKFIESTKKNPILSQTKPSQVSFKDSTPMSSISFPSEIGAVFDVRTDPPSQDVTAGETVTFRCSASSPSGARPTLEWTRQDGGRLQSNARDDGRGTLVIYGVSANDVWKGLSWVLTLATTHWQPKFFPIIFLKADKQFTVQSWTWLIFLDAFWHLYKRVCPSVHPSVGKPYKRGIFMLNLNRRASESWCLNFVWLFYFTGK